MKPVDKFSIQYSELLEYIYPVTQEYFPDFGYDEETGQTYMLPSQTKIQQKNIERQILV